MYQQVGILYKFRFLFTGIFAIAALMLGSMFITVAGANTIFSAQPYSPTSTVSTSTTDSPNAMTTSTSALVEDARIASISIGRGIYRTSWVITTTTSQISRTIMRSSVAAISSAWKGVAFVGKGIGNGVMVVLRLPGKAIASMTHAHAVSAFVRPADNAQTPVISAQTSDTVLTQYNEQQRLEIAKLLAAQLTANEDLGGLIVSGDPSHGGYPANLDNARQDSLTDSWGMYNRECVSYAAWKVHQTYGHMPHWGGVGNANQWAANAKAAGIPVSSTPKVHSVAISMNGYYGHAMWVEAISGSMVYVSQYNYDLRGHYSEMWVNGSGLTYLYFQ